MNIRTRINQLKGRITGEHKPAKMAKRIYSARSRRGESSNYKAIAKDWNEFSQLLATTYILLFSIVGVAIGFIFCGYMFNSGLIMVLALPGLRFLGVLLGFRPSGLVRWWLAHHRTFLKLSRTRRYAISGGMLAGNMLLTWSMLPVLTGLVQDGKLLFAIFTILFALPWASATTYVAIAKMVGGALLIRIPNLK